MTDHQSLDMDAILDEALDELDDDDDDDSENDDNITNEQNLSSLQHSSSKTGTTNNNDVVETIADDDDSETNEDSEDDEEESKSRTSQSNAEIDEEDDDNMPSSPAAVFQNMLRDFIEGDDDDDDNEIDPDERLSKFMDQVQAHLPPDINNDDNGINNKNNKNMQQQGHNSDDVDGVEQTIASILEEMSKANINIGGGEDDGDGVQFPDDFDPSSFFGGDGPDTSSFNPDAVIDGMMEQLLSKDLMYEPMKQVSEKFPSWLEENKTKIPSDEYEKRVKQYECFRKLVQVYETQPDNINELLELMQQVQEYGQPPQDIINEIAPGLELDDDGMPKFNPMDGIPGLGGENEDCTIM